MDQKFYEALNQFMEEHNPKDMDEANKLLQEFINLYNNGKIDYEASPLAKAYEILEEAKDEVNEKKRVKLIKKALEVCPECLEAKLLLAVHQDRPIKVLLDFKEALDEEKDRLKNMRWFAKEHIGHFYGIYETRPYIGGLYGLANMYANAGMISRAIDVAKEILRLNESDNTGTRYLLMGLYAYLEDINNMNKLYNKYREENLHMLVPFLVYYYKQGEYREALKYLDRIKKVNKNFVTYFEDELESDGIPDAYSLGDMSEVEAVVSLFEFLFATVPGISELIVEDIKDYV